MDLTTDITPVYISRHCIAVRLRMLTRGVTKLYNDALRPRGLTISQMNILIAIACMGEARQQQVCEALRLEKSTLSRDVVRMIARRWLLSARGAAGRTLTLRLSASGKALLRAATPAWKQAQEKALALIGEEEVVALERAEKALRTGGIR